MNPARMLEIRKALGLTQRQMSALLRLKGRDGRAVRQYEKGENSPSGPVTLIYELLESAVSSWGDRSLNEWAAMAVRDAKAGTGDRQPPAL